MPLTFAACNVLFCYFCLFMFIYFYIFSVYVTNKKIYIYYTKKGRVCKTIINNRKNINKRRSYVYTKHAFSVLNALNTQWLNNATTPHLQLHRIGLHLLSLTMRAHVSDVTLPIAICHVTNHSCQSLDTRPPRTVRMGVQNCQTICRPVLSVRSFCLVNRYARSLEAGEPDRPEPIYRFHPHPYPFSPSLRPLFSHFVQKRGRLGVVGVGDRGDREWIYLTVPPHYPPASVRIVVLSFCIKKGKVGCSRCWGQWGQSWTCLLFPPLRPHRRYRCSVILNKIKEVSGTVGSGGGGQGCLKRV